MRTTNWLSETRKLPSSSSRTCCGRWACSFVLHCPAACCMTYLFLCAQVHSERQTIFVICLDIKGYIFGRRSSSDLCGSLPAPPQQPWRKSCALATAADSALHVKMRSFFCHREKHFEEQTVRVCKIRFLSLPDL